MVRSRRSARTSGLTTVCFKRRRSRQGLLGYEVVEEPATLRQQRFHLVAALDEALENDSRSLNQAHMTSIGRNLGQGDAAAEKLTQFDREHPEVLEEIKKDCDLFSGTEQKRGTLSSLTFVWKTTPYEGSTWAFPREASFPSLPHVVGA